MDAAAESARDRRPRRERLRPQEDGLPVRKLAQRREARRGPRASEPEWSSITISLRFGAGAEELEVDARARRRGSRRGSARRRPRRPRPEVASKRVDPSEQLLAQRAARRVGEPLGREERRDGQRLGVAEREVGEARQARLEAVHDVEAALAQREREVRADADRDAEARSAARSGIAGPTAITSAASPRCERAAAGEQVGRAARRSEHGDRVPERPQLPRDPGDVLVDVVRLRPRERRHEAQAETHAPSVALSVPLPRRAHDRRGPGTLGSRFERTWPTLVQRGQPGRRRVAPSRATQQRPTVCWSSCRCCGPSVVLRPRSEGSRRVARPGQACDAIPSQWSCRFLLRLPDGSDSRHRPGR